MYPDSSFWRGKRVLLTGHTGFKGAWLALWLQRLGAQVTGLALAPATTPALFTLAGVAQGMDSHVCDVRDGAAVAALVQAAPPDIVLHLAAQALVRPGYAAPLDTFATNVMGTAHVLDALRGQPRVRVAVVVTTDKVYRNREWVYPYREDDPLGGHDPYSASKAASELVAASYRDSFLAVQGVAVATARAGVSNPCRPRAWGPSRHGWHCAKATGWAPCKAADAKLRSRRWPVHRACCACSAHLPAGMPHRRRARRAWPPHWTMPHACCAPARA